jgi:hypothetical protein
LSVDATPGAKSMISIYTATPHFKRHVPWKR